MSKLTSPLVRKDLRSMHQDLHDWSVVLNDEETKLLQWDSVFDPSSIHNSIGSCSSKYRPLSMSFQKWESHKQSMHSKPEAAVNHDSIHSEIQLLASKLHHASDLLLNCAYANEGLNVYQDDDMKNKAEVRIFVSCGSPILNQESIDDPFSAKLDNILDSEEQEFQFSYDTPPNTPSMDKIYFAEENPELQHLTKKEFEISDSVEFTEDALASQTRNDVEDAAFHEEEMNDIGPAFEEYPPPPDFDSNINQHNSKGDLIKNENRAADIALFNDVLVNDDKLPGSHFENEVVTAETYDVTSSKNQDDSMPQDLELETIANSSELNTNEESEFAIAEEVNVASMLKTAAITELHISTTNKEKSQHENARSDDFSENYPSSILPEPSFDTEEIDQKFESFVPNDYILQQGKLSYDNVIANEETIDEFTDDEHQIKRKEVELEVHIGAETAPQASHKSVTSFLSTSTASTSGSSSSSKSDDYGTSSESSSDSDSSISDQEGSLDSDTLPLVIDNIYAEGAARLPQVTEDNAYEQSEKGNGFKINDDEMVGLGPVTSNNDLPPVNIGTTSMDSADAERVEKAEVDALNGSTVAKFSNIVVVEKVAVLASNNQVPITNVLIEEANPANSSEALSRAVLVEEIADENSSIVTDSDSYSLDEGQIETQPLREISPEREISTSRNKNWTPLTLPVDTVSVKKVTLKPLNLSPLVKNIFADGVSECKSSLCSTAVAEEGIDLASDVADFKEPTSEGNFSPADSASPVSVGIVSRFKHGCTVTNTTFHHNSSVTLSSKHETLVCESKEVEVDQSTGPLSVIQNKIVVNEEKIVSSLHGKSEISEKNAQSLSLKAGQNNIAKASKDSFAQKKKIFEQATEMKKFDKNFRAKLDDKGQDATIGIYKISSTPTSPRTSVSSSCPTSAPSAIDVGKTALLTAKPFSVKSSKCAPVIFPSKIALPSQKAEKTIQPALKSSSRTVSPLKPKPSVLPKPHRLLVQDKKAVSLSKKIEVNANKDSTHKDVATSHTSTSEDLPPIPSLPDFVKSVDSIENHSGSPQSEPSFDSSYGYLSQEGILW